MAYGEAKVYFDGSHYIAIPHTTRPTKRRYRYAEEEVIVGEDRNENKKESTLSVSEGVPFELEEINIEEIEDIAELFKASPPPTEKQKRVAKKLSAFVLKFSLINVFL